MTEEERKRLNELDDIIVWERDTGRSLTEEERDEHARLLWKALKEYESKHD